MSITSWLVPENPGLIAEEEALIKRHPLPFGIFLPTDAIPLRERVVGLRKVIDIYENKWRNIYAPKLVELRERYQGQERVFVIGNGPSLNKMDLSKMKGECSFGVNGIFLKFLDTDFRPTFYVVEDHLVAEDRRAQINPMEGMVKLFPINLAYCVDEGPDTIFFDHRPRFSYPDGFDFSTDASACTYAGCTVTFTCLQLAFYLGIKNIYLIGVDFDYKLPGDIKKVNSYGVASLDMDSDDPNHFHPDYFGKGYRWHDPQVDKMGEAYMEAKKVCDANGVNIFNATIGGKLEIFPRVDYESLF